MYYITSDLDYLCSLRCIFALLILCCSVCEETCLQYYRQHRSTGACTRNMTLGRVRVPNCSNARQQAIQSTATSSAVPASCSHNPHNYHLHLMQHLIQHSRPDPAAENSIPKTRSSVTAEKKRVSCACLPIGWLTDRAMHRTPQNRRGSIIFLTFNFHSMRPNYGCSENFREFLTTPKATITEIFNGFLF